MKLYTLLPALLLAGCTAEVDVKATGIYDCKDLRDGESWSFDAANVRDTRVGFGAPSTFRVVDTAGRERLASSDQETYIKCVRRT